MSHRSRGKGPPPGEDPRARFLTAALTRSEVTRRAHAIYRMMLLGPAPLPSPNFQALSEHDLERLFALYDAEFFAGLLSSLLRESCDGAIDFRLSRRMTSAAGKTTRTRRRRLDGSFSTEYEIAVSLLLIGEAFSEGANHADVQVCGITCRDRLEALQRIFEHELIHLLEMVLWGTSSCSGPNFRALAHNLFAHSEARHALVTPRQRAATQLAIKVGDKVAFEYEGRHHHGVVNRITRRATVLVEDERGAVYSNGKRYLKFYVPLNGLVRPDARPKMSGRGE